MIPAIGRHLTEVEPAMIRPLAVAICVFASTLASPVVRAQSSAPPPTVDVTGKWTASFETQIGTQTYTYELVAKDKTLTGKITSSNGPATLSDGKIDGSTVSFTETLDFQGTPLTITYVGTIASPDEIKFTRHVADVSTEELVAKRAK